MATDAEIEAAVVAMRAIRVKGAKVHEEVVRAYARAATVLTFRDHALRRELFRSPSRF